MADNNQNKEKSGLDHMASAAGAVKGAIKAGKQLAGASKGAALGPYGLAAGLAWENRKVIAKIVVALVAVLLLPVMILMMLPSALFGWMFPSDDTMPDNDIVVEEIMFEDYEKVMDVFDEVCVEVDGVFADAHVAVLQNINADFASYGANDTMSVTDPYSATLPHNASRIICEYSALTDFEETIDADDLTAKLSEHKDNFFFFMKVEEQRSYTQTVTYEDGTQGEITVPYTHVDYTVIYIGDDYITEDVFGLTEEQKELAADFADSLSLYAGGENDGTTD